MHIPLLILRRLFLYLFVASFIGMFLFPHFFGWRYILPFFMFSIILLTYLQDRKRGTLDNDAEGDSSSNSWFGGWFDSSDNGDSCDSSDSGGCDGGD
jgi:hypothetical protein